MNHLGIVTLLLCYLPPFQVSSGLDSDCFYEQTSVFHKPKAILQTWVFSVLWASLGKQYNFETPPLCGTIPHNSYHSKDK